MMAVFSGQSVKEFLLLVVFPFLLISAASFSFLFLPTRAPQRAINRFDLTDSRNV